MGNVLKIVAGVILAATSVFQCAIRHPVNSGPSVSLGVPSMTAVPPAAALPSGGGSPVVADANAAAGSASVADASAPPAEDTQLTQLLATKPIQFVSGRAEFTAQGQAVVDEVAALLARAPAGSWEVAGHTDDRGDPQSNVTLSQARAEAVIAYLAARGLDRARFTAKGYGADKPIADNATQAGRQRNRRIEFVRAGG